MTLLHQEEVTMVGEGGKHEKKTAYFYEISRETPTSFTNIDCDSFFCDAYATSRLDFGDRYHRLMKQRMQYETNFSKIITRNNHKEDENNPFITYSDEETVT
jgi:hypothetical protein